METAEMWLKRPLTWIVVVALVILAALPVAVAERYTSPTQDGQYSVHPLRAYQFVWALVDLSGAAALSSSGAALTAAKRAWVDTGLQPTRVELLFFGDAGTYTYVTRSRDILELKNPPTLVWEVWGSSVGTSTARDVIGFLDYSTGARLDSSPESGPANGSQTNEGG